MKKTRRKYSLLNVDVVHREERRSSWQWGGRAVKGIEHVYDVVDRNFDRLNRWTFSLRIPAKADQVIVQPQTIPGKKVFAGLDRRSIIFNPATTPRFANWHYCKANLSDPSKEKNRIGTTRSDRQNLPKWLQALSPRIHPKSTVASTEGSDGNSLVIRVKGDDHETMIRLFFALRVWVLQEGFSLKE